MKSYAKNGDEVYPVLVVELPDKLPNGQNWYTPTEEQVPDVKRTGEVWSLYPIKPIRSEIKWLSMYSIICDEDEEICTAVEFVKDLTDKNHPWLNFKGHPLESSQMENEPWEGNMDAHHPCLDQFKFMETRVLRQPVYAVPTDNAYALCFPVDERTAFCGNQVKWPVRTTIKDLRRHTGCHDQNGVGLFVDTEVRYNGAIGRVQFQRGTYGVTWFDNTARTYKFTPFYEMDTDNEGRICDVLSGYAG